MSNGPIMAIEIFLFDEEKEDERKEKNVDKWNETLSK